MTGDSARPVDQAQYSAEWIDAAWSETENRALLDGSPLTPRPRIARALELANLQPGLRLLDIACGRGEVLAIAGTAGVRVIGLDYAEESICFAARVTGAREPGMGGSMALVRADATRLPFPDASVDRVTMLDIVEHLLPRELESMFREVRRVLAPGGYAVVHTLPNRWVYEFGYPVARLLLRGLPREPRNEYEKLIHVNEQDLVALDTVLSRCGLQGRLWLEQQIVRQARWKALQQPHSDHRRLLYRSLTGAGGLLLEALSYTPLKLLLCNDIFAVLWPDGATEPALPPLPLALTERALLSLARWLRSVPLPNGKSPQHR